MTRSQEPQGESFAARLKKEYGEDADPGVSLEPIVDDAPGSSQSNASSELLRRLSDHSLTGSRYRLLGEIARGGMGAILKVWDEDLRRTLAMKVILGKTDRRDDVATTPVDSRTLGRFLEEAQVTGQLDHPGIAPVHELGLDSDGRVYFTMKLVKGRDLKQVFNLVFEHKEGWNETRALSVMLKVCEAMAYAHSKGVIHRDLKPANVMVGAFGEVYVMDWGLAHVVGRKDRHDIRLRPEFTSSLSAVRTERSGGDDGEDSPLITMDGDIMGTPAYMPPEQARGEIEQLSARSDVYAIGAMLYHLLARKMPYVPKGARVSSRTMLLWVLEGPPKSLHELRPEIPAELAAICEKAMARDAADRYANTLALAEDLRAFLEHRVVGAYETGTWAETKKWIERNRLLAASFGAGVLALVAGLVLMSSLKHRADTSAALAEARRVEAESNERIAKVQEAIAKREKANVLRLSAFQTLDDLVQEADAMWPPEPALIERYRGWLVRAESLAAKFPEFQNALVEIEQRSQPSTTEEEDGWWHAQMQKLVAGLTAFADEEHGLLHGLSAEHGAGVALRLDFATTIEERSTRDPRWEPAIEAIATSDAYRKTSWPGGGRLAPQLGLVPIGEDPQSHLWEFAHVQSGAPAVRDGHGKLVLSNETGIVFVLIPGGSFTMGAQQRYADQPVYDPMAQPDEFPPHLVQLGPYFLSKYEMTQGQWRRCTGDNPSQDQASPLNPVEQVSWPECARVLARMGLALPSEAQWEYGCRGGTETPWWTGTARESLLDHVNIADHTAMLAGATWPGITDWPDFDDGWVHHAPVGTFAANPYGLHEVHGNVWEWCADSYAADFYVSLPFAEPLAPNKDGGNRVFRGGGFGDSATEARSARRGNDAAGNLSDSIGLRPARVVN